MSLQKIIKKNNFKLGLYLIKEETLLNKENCEEVLKKAKKKIYEEKLPYTLIVEKGLFDERH